MQISSKILVGLVALLHVWFLILEMFLWQHPIGLKTFGNTPELAAEMAVLAGNQGLYNGFLATGLIFGMFHRNKNTGISLQFFCLLCIISAGIFGAITAKFSILFIQALPATLAFGVLWFSTKDIRQAA